MSEMADYDGRLEGSSERDATQPNGVSEDPRNEGWSHRTNMEAIDSKKRKSISQRVSEGRNGKTYYKIDPEESRIDREKRERPKSENHGETESSDYEYGRELTKAEKAAMRFGDNWPIEKKQSFLANKTDLPRSAFDWQS